MLNDIEKAREIAKLYDTLKTDKVLSRFKGTILMDISRDIIMNKPYEVVMSVEDYERKKNDEIGPYIASNIILRNDVERLEQKVKNLEAENKDLKEIIKDENLGG